MVSTHSVLTAALICLLFVVSVANARIIPIDVGINPPVKLHLQMIGTAEANDLLEIRVSDGCDFSRSLICRYVSALKTTRASVRLAYIPPDIKAFAQHCDEGQ